jgi:hypothetical protein
MHATWIAKAHAEAMQCWDCLEAKLPALHVSFIMPRAVAAGKSTSNTSTRNPDPPVMHDHLGCDQ